MSEKVDHKILLFFNPHLSSHISNSLENSKLSYELIHCTIFLSNHQTDRVSSIPFQLDSIRLIVQYNLLLYLKKKRNFVEFAPSKSLHVRDPLCARINLTLRKIPKNILDPIKFSWSRPRETKQNKKRKKSISRHVEERRRGESCLVRSRDPPRRRHPSPELPPIDRQLVRGVPEGHRSRLLLPRKHRVRERVPGQSSVAIVRRASTASNESENPETEQKQFGRSTPSFQRAIEPLEDKQLHRQQANAVR